MADQNQDRGGWGVSRRGFLEATAVAASMGGWGPMQTTAASSPLASGPDPARRFDVAVVGGGPAGLSAALVLGRACLKVLVCDGGPGRNAPTAAVHGFLGQDGTAPNDLRRIARDQLRPYDVTVEATEVDAARPTGAGFELDLKAGGRVAARKLILATGIKDLLPEIPGFAERWGRSVIHCPYCHGWESRGRPWAFFVPEAGLEEAADMLLGWTTSLTYLKHGSAWEKPERRDWLARRGIGVIDDRIDRLEGTGADLAAIRFAGGRRLEVSTLFAPCRFRQRSPLAEALGCALTTEGWTAGTVPTDAFGATTVPGLYVVGDASSVGVPSVASAVAEGSAAGAMASRAVIREATEARLAAAAGR